METSIYLDLEKMRKYIKDTDEFKDLFHTLELSADKFAGLVLKRIVSGKQFTIIVFSTGCISLSLTEKDQIDIAISIINKILNHYCLNIIL